VANTNRRVIVTGVVLNGLDIRPTLVDGDLLREPLGLNRFVYECLGGVPITIGGQENVHGGPQVVLRYRRLGQNDKQIRIVSDAFRTRIGTHPNRRDLLIQLNFRRCRGLRG